jgi:hypothetical protein
MKHLILIPLLAAASVAQAAPDIERIHKDVTVMSTIFDAAFEAEESCQKCAPKIESSYLAKQGAVFTIRANTWKSFSFSDASEGFSFVIPPDAPHGVRRVEITEMVGDILSDVGIVMDEMGSHIEHSLADLEHSDTVIRVDSDTRRALRELNRERRELEYQRREYEIELIHADEEDRKRINERIAEVEKQVSGMEGKQNELSKVFVEKKREVDLLRAERQEKAQLQANEQFALIENIVLQSLCDYGTTLKNVPDNEHVSVVFERKNEDKKEVVVMEMDDVTSCTDAKNLKSKATSYQF